jgi:two-component system NtrC family sensor kinase
MSRQENSNGFLRGRWASMSLRGKLVMVFMSVVLLTALVSALVGLHLISKEIVGQAQDKVNNDLNAARNIYQKKMMQIEMLVCHTADRYFLQNALKSGDISSISSNLQRIREKEGLDMLTISDKKGKVLLRTRNPESAGDEMAREPLLRKVLEESKSIVSTEIISREELLKEGKDLAEQAYLKLIPTPRARPTPRTENTSGMMIKAASPVISEDEELLGVLYGGILLNRNYQIVDEVKSTVYQGGVYKGRDMGTATIFQGDLRISTNVLNRDGSRAIGTRVSEEVSERVLREGQPWIDRAFVVNDWYITAYEPIRNIEGKVVGILYVGILERKFTDMKRNIMLFYLFITLTGMSLALFLAYIMANRIIRPIKFLAREAKEIAKGDFSRRVDVRAQDEIGDLEQAFSQMVTSLNELHQRLASKIEAADDDLKKTHAELIKKQDELILSARLASMGKLAASVAHEINNPLTGIRTFAKLLLEKAERPLVSKGKREEFRRYLSLIESEAARSGTIVKNLLAFARQDKMNIEEVNLNQVLERCFILLEHSFKIQNITLHTELEPDLVPISGDFSQIQQALMAILINASEAMPRGGDIRVSTGNHVADQQVWAKIRDAGVGISKENLANLFEPFFTTKEKGKGVGLGLAVTYGIVRNHGGRIEVESEVGEGTTFMLHFPTLKRDSGNHSRS